MDTSPIIVEANFTCTAQKLWESITNREEMIAWFFENIPEFEARVGFSTQFVVNAGERDFTHNWKITEVVPGKKIVYDWSYTEYQGTGKVTFEISELESGSHLKLTNEGLHTFPADIPEFQRESCQGGWNYFIGERLTDYLN